MIKENPKVPLFRDYPNICTKCLVECGNTCIHCGDKKEDSKIKSQQKKIFDCKVCGNEYDNIDALEYHLRKEHTKNELIHYLKIEELNN